MFAPSILKNPLLEDKIGKKSIYWSKTTNSPSIIIIEQIHHSYSNKQEPNFEKKVNKLQKTIYEILKILNQKIKILGIEDLSYKDNLEVDQYEAEDMQKNSNFKLSTWEYEKNFPDHFKTYCVDIVNICGIRKGIAFAGEKLLGKTKALKKQKNFLISHFKKYLLNNKKISAQIDSNLKKIKKDHPEMSDTTIFFLAIIEQQIKGLIEGLGELFSASQISEYALKNLTKTTKTDETEKLIFKLQESFKTYIKKFFLKEEIKPTFIGFLKRFIKLIKNIYCEAIVAAKKIEFILNDFRSEKIIKNSSEIMKKNKEKQIVLVIGAAHSANLIKECKKNKITCILLRPKSELWQEIFPKLKS